MQALVVLAAGRSTRFGRLKQLEPVGPGGEALLDYAIYDSFLAGFSRFVLIVQEDRQRDFERHLESAREAGLDIRFVNQELDPRGLGLGYSRDRAAARRKPWGTGFAVLSARDHLDRPFAACNADDFYGRGAYAELARALESAARATGGTVKAAYGSLEVADDTPEAGGGTVEVADADIVPAFTVGYPLEATLSASGGVSRGVCQVGENRSLEELVEGLALRRDGDRVRGHDVAGNPLDLSPGARVCTGLWGFLPEALPLLERRFAAFLDSGPGPEAEFYLTEAVNDLVAAGKLRCRVLPTEETWLGVTFTGDRPAVVAALRGLAESGVYPPKLWGRHGPGPQESRRSPWVVAKPVSAESGVHKEAATDKREAGATGGRTAGAKNERDIGITHDHKRGAAGDTVDAGAEGEPKSADNRWTWRAVAPGRVNLIGEHTDYNGLPVLPMTLDRDLRIDFRALDEPIVQLAAEPQEFEPFLFRLDRPIVSGPTGDWSNYVRGAARGLLGHGVVLDCGIEGTVSGDAPIAAGLSSSSALVVAAALALLKANETSMPRLELAALMARAERFAGLEGGGMDQAVCLHGAKGVAVRIDFEPLRVAPVPMPRGWHWVVASSLVRAEKTGTAREAYNTRTRECREALQAVMRTLPDDCGTGRGEEKGAVSATSYAPLCDTFSEEELLERGRKSLTPVLFRRFRHVVTEGRRVALAQQAMKQARIADFGQLMVRSHESLRDDYEVSTPELDKIVSLAVEAGAAGARLTGAGFGGCAVALCDRDSAHKVMEALAEGFYRPRLGRPPNRDEMFLARAADGARVEEA